MRNLLETGQGAVDYRDFLARADVLAAAGKTVLISDYSEYFRLTNYLRRYTQQSIAIVLGANSLPALFDEKYYADLDGGILEGFGRLFKKDTRVYVYPYLEPGKQELVTAANFAPARELSHLYGYLRERGGIEALEGYDKDLLNIFTPDVLRKIRKDDPDWERGVIPEVAAVIKKRGLFGYKRGAE